MTPPISIDGTDITGATIDGTDVQEITVDGQTVFSASFSYFDDFDTNTFSEYTLRNVSSVESSSNWDISNSELTHPDSSAGEGRSFEYDLSSENLSGNLAVQMTISSYPDDDALGCGIIDTNDIPYVAGSRQQFSDNFGLNVGFNRGSSTWPPDDLHFVDPFRDADVTSTSSFTFTTPFVFRLEYDDSLNQLELFVDGTSRLTHPATIGNIKSVFWGEGINDPAASWDSVKIEEF